MRAGPIDTYNTIVQSIPGSTSEQQNTWSNMASTVSGIGLMTVRDDIEA
jgi:hypothetical protein